MDAGKPFEQMQDAGMRTAQLDRIMRQKDPELLRAVEHLSKNETAKGVELLQQQGRITEIPDRERRIEAIAKDYAAKPANTLVVSPDNASRRDINEALRKELKSTGALSKEDRTFSVLTQRSELTSADRSWAAKYQPGDLLYYTRGSKQLGIERGSYGTVVSVDAGQNRLTVKRADGEHVTYDPKRLQGITAYREISRDFSVGDRLQFTASRPDLDLKNRDLGTIQKIEGTAVTVRLDGEKGHTLTFDSSRMRHFDHGYAVTSHSSQGLTTNRVLVNMDTTAHPGLINTRFAYVSISRASQDARVYTNDAATLGKRLSADIGKTSALQVARPKGHTSIHDQREEKTVTNMNDKSPEEQGRSAFPDAASTAKENATLMTETDRRHYAPILAALPNQASSYEWKRETGDIQSYQHIRSGGPLHLDSERNFYDRHAQPVSREIALERATHPHAQTTQEHTRTTKWRDQHYRPRSQPLMRSPSLGSDAPERQTTHRRNLTQIPMDGRERQIVEKELRRTPIVCQTRAYPTHMNIINGCTCYFDRDTVL